MSDHTKDQKAALDEFSRISNILAVPTAGKPLPDHRKWILPCPDKQAFDDYPESTKKRDKWLKEWTSCKKLTTGSQQANQSSKAT